MKIAPVMLLLLLGVSCKDKTLKVSAPVNHPAPKSAIKDTAIVPGKVKATDYIFFSDSILHGHRAVLKHYMDRYGGDTACHSYTFYDKEELKKNFKGLHYIGHIRNKRFRDSVFILDPLNFCKQKGEKRPDGQAYYFTDTTLPRLQTDSYCCDPSSIFLVGDIDEDGIAEIGEYYSSCASHYKSLYVYSLKNDEWKEAGHCVYDLFYVDTDKPFNYFVRKTGKGKFEMLEITDLTKDKTKVGKRNWIKFSI